LNQSGPSPVPGNGLRLSVRIQRVFLNLPKNVRVLEMLLLVGFRLLYAREKKSFRKIGKVPNIFGVKD
jgi:hypothetical protein